MYAITASIAAHAADACGVDCTEKGMYGCLVARDFACKQTSGFPAKLDPEKPKAFVEAYNKRKANLSENEVLLFMDRVHPTQATKLGRGWMRKGQVQEVPTVAGGKRMRLTHIPHLVMLFLISKHA